MSYKKLDTCQCLSIKNFQMPDCQMIAFDQYFMMHNRYVNVPNRPIKIISLFDNENSVEGQRQFSNIFLIVIIYIFSFN